ncbi:MAG: hypothetical protein GY742_11430, partial [Hyphomicrobiales bacterium]|nr:hypothetical protein [Hyphomicrobiales bacterium]
MRKDSQSFGLPIFEKSLEITTRQNVNADNNNPSAYPDKRSDSKNDQKQSPSLKQALAELDRLFSEDLIGKTDLASKNKAIGESSLEESLEEELTSNFYRDASSLFMPDLHDEDVLEEAATSVSDECNNLIGACETPEQVDPDVLDDIDQNQVSLMSLGKGTERIGGIIAEAKIDTLAKAQKSKIVFASLILPAMFIGAYLYLNPQEVMQLVSISKIDQHVIKQTGEPASALSVSANVSADKSVEMSQDKLVESENVTKLSSIPIRSAVHDIRGAGSVSVEETKPPIAVSPELSNIVETQNEAIPAIRPPKKDDSRITYSEVAVLTERFDQEAMLNTNQRNNLTLSEPDIRQSVEKTPGVSSQLIAEPRHQLGSASTRRDLESVKRGVQLANVGDVLDSAQLKTFISGLA